MEELYNNFEEEININKIFNESDYYFYFNMLYN